MERLASSIRIAGVGVRGRGLGLRIPTITLAPDEVQEIPEGVYASLVSVDGVKHRGATSVGVAGTVGAVASTIETHVLDYEGDLVGKRMELELVRRLRGMEVFSSLQALEEQIAGDIEIVRSLVY